jgi:hypothetical protein
MSSESGLLGLLLRTGRQLQNWAQENPEAIAKILLWAEEGDSSRSSADGESSARSFADLILPANWMTLRLGVLNRARHLMTETGICLAWVPGPDVIESIVGASTKEERDQVLIANSDSILDDIEHVVAEVNNPQLLELRSGAEEAVSAFEGGLCMASQAMSAAVITAVLEDHYGFKRFDEARRVFDTEHPNTASVWSSRRIAVQWAIRQAILGPHQRPVDGGFSRHLTAHSVNRTQYNEPNALNALLLAAGSLRELQEIYCVGKRGFAVTAHLQRLTAGTSTAPV